MTRLAGLRLRISPLLITIGENVLMYSVATGIIWYEFRGISFRSQLNDLANARLKWFIPASLGSFLIWFLGENFLFARIFTAFHRRTGYFELLPATAAVYFLQTINIFIADGALMVFLHQRKQVPWFDAGFTMAFLGFIDGILFSAMIALGGYLVPDSPVHAFAPYSAGAFVLFILIAGWWLWREPRTGFERWIYQRPSLTAFREATLPAYCEFLFIRFCILAPQGILLWICLRAFNLPLDWKHVIVLSPAILAAGGVPITPAGLGPMQAVAVNTFSKFAAKSKVMAAMLAFSLSHILYRLPLGIGAAHTFIRHVIRTGGRKDDSDI